MGISIDIAPEVRRGPDSQDVASRVLEIAAQLTQAPAESERSILEWAFARIGALVEADVVAVREIRSDGLCHFVGGWSRIPFLLDGPQPPLRIREGKLTSEQLATSQLSEMPIDADADEIEKWRTALATAKVDHPQTVFSPLITGTKPTGFLCLVARPGVVWDAPMLQAFATAAALLAQFRARVHAELALQRQLAFSDLFHSIAERLLTIVPGEETKEIESALAAIGQFLGLVSIGLWEVQHDETASLSHRWLDPSVGGSISPNFTVACDDVPRDLIHLGREDTIVRTAAHLSRFRAFVDDVETEREFLILPLSVQPMVGALVIGSHPGREWTSWERSGLAAFATSIPTLRARLEAEEQLVAAFHAAPIGIIIRDSNQRLVECNEAFASFLGYNSEFALLRTEPAEILATDWAIDFANEIAARPTARTEAVELPFRHASGRTVWGRLSFRHMHIRNRPMVLAHVEDVTVERANRLELQHRTLHDELTGVANRRQMLIVLGRLMEQAALEEALPEEEAAKHVAVLMLDLDGFKQVNDQHGHLVGDQVLREAACRIVGASRDTDLVARLGGDEFVVILPGPISIEQSERAADRIRKAVAEPLNIGEANISMKVSIGTAVPGPNITTIEQLLAAADQAMYSMKARSASARKLNDNRR